MSENDNNEYTKGEGDTGKRARLCWTKSMDEYLINALYHQMIVGNKQGRTFTSSAYDNVVMELRQKTKYASIDKEKIKNRWLKTVKPNFHEAFDLFNNSNDFAWSPISCLFEAESKVWQALIEKKPTAKKWMTKPFMHYDKLQEILGNNRVTYQGAKTVEEKTRRWAQEKNEVGASKIYEIDHMIHENQVKQENTFSAPCHDLGEPTAPIIQTSPNTSPTNVSSVNAQMDFSLKAKGKKRKVLNEEIHEKHYEKIHLAIENMVEAVRIGNEIIKCTRPRVYSEEEVFEELVNIGIKEDLRFPTYEFLIENPTRVRSFFGCPPKERKGYLLRKMHNEGGNIW